jgi:hypothetical protein
VTCDTALEAVAVRLLTSGPAEPDVDAHVASCASCRDEVARLTPLPGLLESAAADIDLLGQPPPGDALLARLLAAAAEERRERRRAWRFVAAAAAALVLLVPVGVWTWDHHSGSPGAVSASQGFSTMAHDPSTGVTGHVQLTAAAWGSTLAMSISGVTQGTRCTLVVVTSDGSRQTAATWQASYRGTAHVQGTVAAPMDTIARVDVVDSTSGRVLLRVPGPA